VTRAQAVVTYFNASHQPLALLRAAAETLGITKGLQSSNKTRMTSVHICLESIRDNKMAFQVLLHRHPDVIKKDAVVATLRDNEFWGGLEALCNLLQPISQAIMAIQGANATLADVTRWASTTS
jgi:hypothetical protein